jgi:hypothetical protein
VSNPLWVLAAIGALVLVAATAYVFARGWWADRTDPYRAPRPPHRMYWRFF